MAAAVFRTRDASEYLGMPQSTLEKLRLRGDGPPFIRLTGRAIGYLKEDLDRWLRERRVSSTSQQIDGSQK